MTNELDVRINWEQLSNEAMDDRRIGRRVTLQFVLEISGKDKSGENFHVNGRTRNVSDHGCCFELEHKVYRGEILDLKVIRHDSEGRIESTDPLRFRATWVTQEGEMWIVGAEKVAAQEPWGIAFPPKAPR